MIEYVERAAFLDQVQVGQRFKMHVSLDDGGPWTVTARRVEDISGRPVICLIGIADDGSPRSQMGAGWCSVVIYELVSDEARP